MTWGIIGAMPSEIALLETQMSGAKKEVVSGLTYQTGKICGKDVVLCCSEIGKVNAAMCAQTLALRYNVDCMVNTGVAGCTCDDLGVLDIVLSRDLVFHDFDWEIMEDYHPHTSKFPGDPSLIACLVIRSMSDNANGDAGMSFDTFEKIAADHSAKLLLSMLELAQ